MLTLSLLRPGTSSLNFGAGSTVSNAAIVSLSLDGYWYALRLGLEDHVQKVVSVVVGMERIGKVTFASDDVSRSRKVIGTAIANDQRLLE